MYKKALTLMEIIVSTVILAIVMLGMINIFVAGKKYILHSRSRMTSGELGKYFLDPLQMQVRQDEWASNCLGSGTNCSTSTWTDPSSNITYTPTYEVSNVLAGQLRKVKVTISWSEP